MSTTTTTAPMATANVNNDHAIDPEQQETSSSVSSVLSSTPTNIPSLSEPTGTGSQPGPLVNSSSLGSTGRHSGRLHGEEPEFPPLGPSTRARAQVSGSAHVESDTATIGVSNWEAARWTDAELENLLQDRLLQTLREREAALRQSDEVISALQQDLEVATQHAENARNAFTSLQRDVHQARPTTEQLVAQASLDLRAQQYNSQTTMIEDTPLLQPPAVITEVSPVPAATNPTTLPVDQSRAVSVNPSIVTGTPFVSYPARPPQPTPEDMHVRSVGSLRALMNVTTPAENTSRLVHSDLPGRTLFHRQEPQVQCEPPLQYYEASRNPYARPFQPVQQAPIAAPGAPGDPSDKGDDNDIPVNNNRGQLPGMPPQGPPGMPPAGPPGPPGPPGSPPPGPPGLVVPPLNPRNPIMPGYYPMYQPFPYPPYGYDMAPRPAQAPRAPEAAKPKLFNGKDPEALLEFVSKLTIIFMQTPAAFPTDQTKVMYASSFLTGSPSQWFNNFLVQVPVPSVITSWDTFVFELNAMFGDRNRPHTAQTALASIKMNDTHRVNQFIIEFDKWSTLSGYDEVALALTFYNVLSEHVKNLFVTMGRPNTLLKLREQALRFDQRYWDRQME